MLQYCRITHLFIKLCVKSFKLFLKSFSTSCDHKVVSSIAVQ